jgi:transcriptional regulator with XRE-family HTH domain
MSSKKDLKRAVGCRLKEVRDHLSYTQDRMSALIEISRTYYAKQETGESFPGHMVLTKLGNRLNVSLDWLLCAKGEMFFPDPEKEKEEKLPVQEPVQAEAPGTDEPGLALSPEYRRLIEDMQRVPLLHYEVMAFYHRYLLDRPGLFDQGGQSDHGGTGDG